MTAVKIPVDAVELVGESGIAACCIRHRAIRAR